MGRSTSRMKTGSPASFRPARHSRSSPRTISTNIRSARRRSRNASVSHNAWRRSLEIVKSRSTPRPRRQQRRNAQGFLGVLCELYVQTSHFFTGSVTKLRLKPPSEASLLGGRSAAAAKTASKAERPKTCFICEDIGFRRCLDLPRSLRRGFVVQNHCRADRREEEADVQHR